MYTRIRKACRKLGVVHEGAQTYHKDIKLIKGLERAVHKVPQRQDEARRRHRLLTTCIGSTSQF
jgi:hypothetical protein